MGIRTLSLTDSTKLQKIRRLMVNNTEKFRLVLNNDTAGHKIILYAKGKINFNLNWPKDGAGISFGNYDSGRSITNAVSYFSNFYAFYGEGFYRKELSGYDKFYKYDNTLSSIVQNAINYFINHPYHGGKRDYVLTFEGWYTSASGGKEVNTLEDVQTRTSLFDYKSKDGLPEITLYAHWKVPTYTIKIHNIYHNKQYSSFKYDGKITTKTASIRNVLYRANILEEINKHVSNPKYITWANNTTLGNKDTAAKLKAGPQKFIGWSRNKNTRIGDLFYENGEYDYLHSDILWTSKNVDFSAWQNWVGYGPKDDERHEINVYPNFQPIVIYPKTKLPNGKIYNGKYYCGIKFHDLDDYCHSDIAPIYGKYDQLWTYEIDGKIGYYKWRVAKTDNKEHKKEMGDWWDGGSIYTSSTTVMKFKKLRD